MKKIINFTSWKLLFPDFIFESLLSHINVEDPLLENVNRAIFVEIAHGLMLIYLDQIQKEKINLMDYINYLLQLASNQKFGNAQKWALGICIMSFVNFISVHFPEENTDVLDKIGYELIMLGG